MDTVLRFQKRPALELTSGVAVDVETNRNPQNLRLITETAKRNSWILNDDWVNRTKGLRLDSPLPTSMAAVSGHCLLIPSLHANIMVLFFAVTNEVIDLTPFSG